MTLSSSRRSTDPPIETRLHEVVPNLFHGPIATHWKNESQHIHGPIATYLCVCSNCSPTQPRATGLGPSFPLDLDLASKVRLLLRLISLRLLLAMPGKLPSVASNDGAGWPAWWKEGNPDDQSGNCRWICQADQGRPKTCQPRPKTIIGSASPVPI